MKKKVAHNRLGQLTPNAYLKLWRFCLKSVKKNTFAWR